MMLFGDYVDYPKSLNLSMLDIPRYLILLQISLRAAKIRTEFAQFVWVNDGFQLIK